MVVNLRIKILVRGAWVLAVILNTTAAFGDSELNPASNDTTYETVTTDAMYDTNPTYLHISPRKAQLEKQQLADQSNCYEFACEFTGWNPYQGYDELASQGYAVALSQQEMEQGLICLAMEGAVAEEIAGEIVHFHGEVIEERTNPAPGAAAGAAIGVSLGSVDLRFLNEPDNPEAQRAVSRFERNLHKWEQKYSGCLRRKGYRVETPED